MRDFADDQGRQWQAVRGSESYGVMVILFAPRDGGQVLKDFLDADTPLAADRELEGMDEGELRRRLGEAAPAME